MIPVNLPVFSRIFSHNKMNIYAILVVDESETKLLPNYFKTYEDALDEVKRIYPDWDDRSDG